tara:strand:- start:433 stop:609 length:177 start_codon:yes stop_codon:yes gene_type:complete
MIADHDIPVISIQFLEQRGFFDMCDVETLDHETIRKNPTVDNAIHETTETRAKRVDGE